MKFELEELIKVLEDVENKHDGLRSYERNINEDLATEEDKGKL